VDVPAVELRGITKVFPRVVANDRVDLCLFGGEIHALLGENGAGKSTLMHILAGVLRPDSGTVLIDGMPVKMDDPGDARAHGIGMVYQHLTLVPGFTVLENVMLGGRGTFRLDRKRARRAYLESAGSLGADIQPDAMTGDLPLGRQQQVEIIKALASGARVLILDEPTALLAPAEVVDLQRAMRSLSERGMAVVLISHKLPEALEVADRVSVLRAGRAAGHLTPDELRNLSSERTREVVVRMMFGDDADALSDLAEVSLPATSIGVRRTLPEKFALRLDGVSATRERQETGVGEVSFEVRRGEIFGVAGVEGNGQRELAEVLAGQRTVTSGVLEFEGEDVTHLGVSERERRGLRFVTEDRMGEGTVSSLPVSINLLLKHVGRRPYWTRGGRTVRGAVRKTAGEIMQEFDVRAPSPETLCGTLSGGNIQKVVLGRELSFAPRLVVYDKPTQGLDARTTRALRLRIQQMAAGHEVAAVLISSDLDELLALCDRIGVMYRGSLAGIVENSGPDVVERLGRLMLGGDRGRAVE